MSDSSQSQAADYPPLPWRTGNHFKLLINGSTFFPAIIDAIDQARETIEVELYLVESGVVANRFIDALIRASERNVTVRMLIDYVGSQRFRARDRNRLNDHGIQLRLYNRFQTKRIFHNLARDHRKIVTIDDEVAFVGGTGISDHFSADVLADRAWRELMLEIRGPVVKDWRALFERGWKQHDGPVGLKHWRQRIYDFTQTHKKHHRLPTDQPQARVNGSRGMGSEQIKGALITELRKAKYAAWFASAYFYPPRKLRKAFEKAARRGVDVRLLLPGPRTDHPSIRYAGRTYYESLLEAGVRIYEYQPSFMHMKIAVVDDWVTAGSCNFDRWNLRWNLEANQEIIDPEFANQVRDMLVEDFKSAKLYTSQTWPERHLLVKLKERFWANVGILLEQLFYR
ncbi:MAG: phospholipase D-like domain-containing protein [Ketobacteraceae bacterium]|nr:phospholipase D-like domain-containing protein [Ketobacteraceae bacterium]